MRQHPALGFYLLEERMPQPLSADAFLELFSVQYSPSGSSSREVEEGIMENWVDYVKDLEEGCKQPPNFYNLTYFLSVLSYTQHDLIQRLDICNWSARDTGGRFPSSP